MTDNDKLDAKVIELDLRQGEKVLGLVLEYLGRFVSYPNEHCHLAHALWCIHAHMMDSWESTPRLAFLSAEPASGKTRALEITELLVPRPVCAVNVSPAYLFRKVGSDDGGATILFDEIDTVFGPKAKENEEIRGLLNAGHRRGAKAGRCVVHGKKVETEEINAYSAVALAGLGWLPDTIMSRAVIVRMRKRHAGERVTPFRRRLHEREGYTIRDAVEAWAGSAEVELPDQQHFPAEIVDRDADVWEPLIAIADAIGGAWPERVRVAAVALVTASQEREPSLGIRLLSDLRTIFGTQDKLTTALILETLKAMPENPWRDMKGRELTDRELSRRLRQYEIKPKAIRVGEAIVRGYERSAFTDAWQRYLPPSPDRSATSATSETVPQNQPHSVAAGVADVVYLSATATARKASRTGFVARVADVADSAGRGGEPDPDGYTFNLPDEYPELPSALDRRGAA